MANKFVLRNGLDFVQNKVLTEALSRHLLFLIKNFKLEFITKMYKIFIHGNSTKTEFEY
jgi:hypothetical protein